jgi:hypothetical protein
MSAVAEVRDAALAKEELQDLLNYLDGLPHDLRHGGAFAAYEQRVGELSREVILSEMAQFAPQLGSKFADALRSGPAAYGRINEELTAVARRHKQDVERKQRVGRAVHWGVLVACAGTMVSAVSLIPLAIPFSGVAFLLEAAHAAWFSKRLKDQERLAAHLSILSEVLGHSFGPSGEILKPSEYYAASTKRVETLLEEINAER